MIYLCFDLGLKNTGVAWADSVKLSQPLETIYHKKYQRPSRSSKKDNCKTQS